MLLDEVDLKKRGSKWTNFVWDELTQELLAEYTLISGTYTIKALNTYGLGLISSNREGVKRYFHFDALGNTAALDDENETLKDSYTYEAFGVVQTATSTNGPSTNPFRFGGQSGVYDDGAMGSASAFVRTYHSTYVPAYAVILESRNGFASQKAKPVDAWLPPLIYPLPGPGPGPGPTPVVVIGSCPPSIWARCIADCLESHGGKARCVATNVGYFCYCDYWPDAPCNSEARKACVAFCARTGLEVAICSGNERDPMGNWQPKVCICKSRASLTSEGDSRA